MLDQEVYEFGTEGTFTMTSYRYFTDKKSQRSHNTVEIKGFLTIFAW
jgi:hypothetical protein